MVIAEGTLLLVACCGRWVGPTDSWSCFSQNTFSLTSSLTYSHSGCAERCRSTGILGCISRRRLTEGASSLRYCHQLAFCGQHVAKHPVPSTSVLFCIDYSWLQHWSC